jgi:SAM-dependent methyltransferase
MSNLYGAELAKVFDTMYQGFIDYEEEYRFYSAETQLCNAHSILEIGCGSGNLAKYFINDFKSYLGLDLSDHMLQLALDKNPTGHFTQADMRSFDLENKYDVALITGRSSSYLLSNKDVSHTFNSVSKALESKGHLIFDCIDAEKFVSYVDQNPMVIHNSIVGGEKFRRVTNWYVENYVEHLINWKANYYKLENATEIPLGDDSVIFKAFNRKDIIRLLEKAKYNILNIEDRPSYAFDTFVVHAQKTF